MITTKRKTSLIVTVLIIMLSVVYYRLILHPLQQYYYAHHVEINGTYLLKPLDIPDFVLTDSHNQPFTKDNLKGHWSMVFFGFTHCEMVCPTTLSALSQMIKILEKTTPQSELPQVVFISIDPLRDTVERLNAYLTPFNPHFIGAKTSTANTAALEQQFHVVSVKSQGKKGDTFTHSNEILLVNPTAKIQAFFSYPHQADVLAKNYNAILSKQP